MISKTTAETTPTKPKNCVEDRTDHVANPNSNAVIPNAYPISGVAITMTIVVTAPMK